MESMYVLFNVMNGDTKPIVPLLRMPIMKLVVIVYTIVSSWAMLSILTAVVSENMIKATRQFKAEVDAEMFTKTKDRSKVILKAIFEKADQESDNTLTQTEWDSLIADHYLCTQLVDASEMSRGDLDELF